MSNLDLARCKVLEVIAETTAPLRPIEDLLAEVPAVTEEDDGETAFSELNPVTTPVRKEVRFSRQQEVHYQFLAHFSSCLNAQQ